MKNTFKYINGYITGQTVGRMQIFGDILNEKEFSFNGVNPIDFVNEFNYLIQSGVKKIYIDINSDGGDVKSGWTIFSTIQNSPVETITTIIGIGASMSGIISQAGKIRRINDYAIFHAHAPKPANENANPDENVLNLVSDSLRTILKSRSKLTDSKIDEFMSGETYLSSKDAFKLGLFDEVVKTGVDATFTNKSEIFSFVNKNYNKTETKMIKVIAKLNLNGDAGEMEILNAINKIETDAKVESDSLKAQIETLKTEIKNERKEKAIQLIETAEKDGKLSFDGENKDATKNAWIDNAVNNYDATKKMIETIKTVSKSVDITDTIADDSKDESKNWDYSDWSKKNPDGLLKMKNENPKRFEKLFNDYVNS